MLTVDMQLQESLQAKYRGLQLVHGWFLRGITGEPAYPGDLPAKVGRQRWLALCVWTCIVHACSISGVVARCERSGQCGGAALLCHSSGPCCCWGSVA